MTTIDVPSPSVNQTKPVASWRHSALLVAFFILLAAAGAVFQEKAHAPKVQAPETDHAPLYLSLIVAEWGLLYFVSRGVRRRGVRLRDLIGGRWAKPGNVVADVGLAVGLWAVWEGIETGWNYFSAHAPGSSIQPFLPHRLDEILAWTGLCVTAGICEEVVFRGYFLRQFAWLTKSRTAGVVLQACLFGVAHGYQGMTACAHIVLYGALFGVLAVWRASLRPGILAHILTDVLAGVFGI